VRTELPYYFEVPEMPEIPFDVSQYYIPEEDRIAAQQDNKNLDDIQGTKNRSQSANWYQSYMTVEENSRGQNKRDFKEVNLYEEVDFELSKLMKEFLGDILNLRFNSILMLRTPANCNSRWHCEGPVFHTRQCALNFPVFGDADVMEGQWATFPRFKNVQPRENEKMGFITKKDMEDTEILCRWDKPTVPAFYNTMIFHRGYNELSDIDRVVLSCAVEDFSDINVVHRKYTTGKLFKTNT
tara:strand:+ start:1744 stop:2463 length:720 start_codon:yes stop_codon:yes gene_type:complete